ncbi:MAG: NAD(P) transhydrogenase subunit alpha [Acidobacteria bacterium]|nr:NAD(P) transhydrogenase subunit alpha [Acidobacteriota bacterium]
MSERCGRNARFVAVLIAGGFLVTNRMLGMFRK